MARQGKVDQQLLLNELHYRDYASWCVLEGREVGRYALDEENLLFGKVPRELQGYWLRNGPGKFKVGRQRIYPLDGDGYIYKVEFCQGKVFVTSKFVKTFGFEQEEVEERVSLRGVFGTPVDRANRSLLERILWVGVGVPRMKNTSNTSIIAFGKTTLLSLWEGGLPYLLDKTSLKTIEKESKLNGALTKGDMFSAHPKIDPFTGLLVNAGPNFDEKILSSPLKDYLKIWQIDQKFKLKSLQRIYLQRSFATMHELSVTENFIVIPQSPIKMSLTKMILGANLNKAWTELSEPLHIYIVHKKKNTSRKLPNYYLFEAPKCFTFHIVNSFETNEGGTLMIDLIIYEKLTDLGKSVSPEFARMTSVDSEDLLSKQSIGKLARFEVNLRSSERKARRTFLYGTFNDYEGVEFPTINPNFEGKEYQFSYFVSLSRRSLREKHEQLKSLVKINVKTKEYSTWTSPSKHLLLNEPSFVPKKNGLQEDEGFLLFSAYHGAISQASSFFVLSTSDMSTLCHFRLDIPIPIGVHTTWVDQETHIPARL